jgi:hypothetical protein
MKKIMRDIVILAMGANMALFAMAYSLGNTDAALIMIGSAVLLAAGLTIGSQAPNDEDPR